MKTKNMLTVILLLVFLSNYNVSNAQKMKEKYTMYTTVPMKVVKGKEKEFESAVKSHIAKFHKEAPHQAILRLILTGPKAGLYVGISGPHRFSDFDSALGVDHDTDWATNVEHFVKYYGTIEHWKKNDKLSFTAPNTENFKMNEVWFIDVKNGSSEKFNETVAKAVSVNEKNGDSSMHTFNTSFSGGDGRDIAIVFGLENWSSYDIDDPFKPKFEAFHGEGSWKKFLDDWNSCIDKIVQQVSKIIE